MINTDKNELAKSKYKYNEKVVIKRGFYKGVIGFIKQVGTKENVTYYSIESNNKSYLVNIKHLRRYNIFDKITAKISGGEY